MKKLRFLNILLIFFLLLSTVSPCFATEETTTPPTVPNTTPTATAPTFDDETPLDGDEKTTTPTGFELQPPLADYNYPAIYTINAKAAVLVELNSHAIVYSLNPDERVYPASLTKIMTCMLALEHGNLEDMVSVTSSSFRDIDEYSSSSGLVEGERLTLREMLYCVMVSSANEACNAVAEYVSGDIETFVGLMNLKAQELGLTGTHYMNPHGLHEEEHYTTARDLATLASWAWQNPQFREYSTTVRYTLPATDFSPERTLDTTNLLTVDDEENRYYYPLARGMKTGFTSAAGRCLISTATQGDLSFMSVVLGCDTYYYDDGTMIDMRFPESEDLLQYGIDHYSFRQVFSDEKVLDQPAVGNAGGQTTVAVRAKCDASVIVPNSVGEKNFKFEFSYLGGLQAPLKAGQTVGTVTAYYVETPPEPEEGESPPIPKIIPIAKADLVTMTEVATVQAMSGERKNTPAPYQISTIIKSDGVGRFWIVVIALVLVVVLLVAVLMLLRARNIRRAKRRAARRRARRRTQ